jgi:hypothetical protein
MVDGHLIHQSVVDKWKEKLLHLENWMAKFVVATSAATDAPASTAVLELHEHFFKNKATAFKMPVKQKHLNFIDQPLFIKAAPYSPQF